MPFEDNPDNIENQEYYAISKPFSTATATDDQVMALAKLRRANAHSEILEMYYGIHGKQGKIIKYWTEINWGYPFGLIEYHVIIEREKEPPESLLVYKNNWVFGPSNRTN